MYLNVSMLFCSNMFNNIRKDTNMQIFMSLHSLTEWGVLALRVMLGIVFIYHGKSKLAMWKMQPSAQMSSGMLSLLKFLSIAEILGGIGVITGLLTQAAAAGFVLIMAGAMDLKIRKMHKPFSGEGSWEIDFILLTAALVLVFAGAGPISLDAVLFGI